MWHWGTAGCARVRGAGRGAEVWEELCRAAASAANCFLFNIVFSLNSPFSWWIAFPSIYYSMLRSQTGEWEGVELKGIKSRWYFKNPSRQPKLTFQSELPDWAQIKGDQAAASIPRSWVIKMAFCAQCSSFCKTLGPASRLGGGLSRGDWRRWLPPRVTANDAFLPSLGFCLVIKTCWHILKEVEEESKPTNDRNRRGCFVDVVSPLSKVGEVL